MALLWTFIFAIICFPLGFPYSMAHFGISKFLISVPCPFVFFFPVPPFFPLRVIYMYMNGPAGQGGNRGDKQMIGYRTRGGQETQARERESVNQP